MIDLKQCSLGIELGSTRIKLCLWAIPASLWPRAILTWENRLENGIWTYPLEEVWQGVQVPTRHWLQMCWPSVASR